MGILSSDPIDGMLSIQLKDFQMFLNFPNVHNSQSTVLIYYKICRDLSKSADFSSNFSSFPLKQVKRLLLLLFLLSFRLNGLQL